MLLDNICTIMTYQCSQSIKMVLSQQHMSYYGFPECNTLKIASFEIELK